MTVRQSSACTHTKRAGDVERRRKAKKEKRDPREGIMSVVFKR
jgi:hypothetical protein